jgi:hypothetical protein
VTDIELLNALIGAGVVGDKLSNEASSSSSAAVLVALAVRTGHEAYLHRARRHAATSRDRQLVELAAGHLAADHERFDALVRDHLVEHPDHVVAAWVAAMNREHRSTNHCTSQSTSPRRNPC